MTKMGRATVALQIPERGGGSRGLNQGRLSTMGNAHLTQVPEELLHASAEEVCGPLLCGSGIRNALWLCAFSELWQLILDVLHLLFV